MADIAIENYEHEGFSGKNCPDCGSKLIINDLGSVWCSKEDCKYGEL